MTTGDTIPAFSDWSSAIDEQDAAAQTKLPLDLIHFCVKKGTVHPQQTEGRLLFSEPDVLRLKLFRFILYSRCLGAALDTCWAKVGEEAVAAGKAAMARLPKDLLETVEEAMNNCRPPA